MSRPVYIMREVQVVAPRVRNDGSTSDYPEAVRIALQLAGIDGWTETETAGYWRGKRESGVTFSIFLPDDEHRAIVAGLLPALRRAMPDQEAIQVVVRAHPDSLVEA